MNTMTNTIPDEIVEAAAQEALQARREGRGEREAALAALRSHGHPPQSDDFSRAFGRALAIADARWTFGDNWDRPVQQRDDDTYIIYSKIVTWGMPNEKAEIPHPIIARSASGRAKQWEACENIIGTGSCTDAFVICHTDRAMLREADISDWDQHGCWRAKRTSQNQY